MSNDSLMAFAELIKPYPQLDPSGETADDAIMQELCSEAEIEKLE